MALVICSNEKCANKTTVVRFLATACFVFFLFPQIAFASVLHIKNLPYWQQKLAEKSLSTIVEKLPSGYKSAEKIEILQVVSTRIFSGYKVSVFIDDSRNYNFYFEPIKNSNWKIKIQKPELPELVAEWFDQDTQKLAEKIEVLLTSVPIESFSWSEDALHKAISALVEEHLPSWQPSFVITEGDEDFLLEVSLSPRMPIVLALEPNVTSTSLPAILHSGIQRDLLLKTSTLAGLPVAWVKKHAKDIETFATTAADQQILVHSLGGESKARFSASELAKLNVRVESKRLALAVWAAAYAGSDEKSAELGVHAGGKFPFFFHTEFELYAEGIVNMRNWGLDGRFGPRWQIFKDVWLGGEFDTEDDTFWAKISLASRLYRFYTWFRYGQYGKYNGAIGYRAADNISLEIEYDSRYDKVWRLKLIGNL